MIQPEDQRIMKIMEALEQTDLFTEEELTLAEDYLLGNVEQQELEKLTFRDMSTLPSGRTENCFGVLNHLMCMCGMDGKETGSRMAQILFAAGQSTCVELLTRDPLFYKNSCYELFPAEPEKRAAIYAVKVGRALHLRNCSGIPELIELAEGNPDNIKKAITYQKHEMPGGRLILYGAYFVAKYPDVGREDALSDAVLEEQDALLMREYEEVIISNLSRLYTNQVVPVSEIQDAVRNGRVDGRILKLAEVRSGVNQYMVQLLGGMSYINYPLSERLKNVVKICLRAYTEGALGIMRFLDLRDDWGKNGGSYDGIFEMDPSKYIKWAAQRDIAILKAQYKRNRDSFLEYMSKADFKVYNTLASVLKELDPEEFQTRLNTEASRQRQRVVNTFVGLTEGNICGDVRAYLEGKTDDIEPFCACGEKLLRAGGMNEMRKFWDILVSYRDGFGYDAFHNKCLALMMLCRGFGKFIYVFNYNYAKTEDVKKLFSAVDSVKLPLKYQLTGYADIAVSYCLGPDGTKVYEAASTEIFRKYLADRREEMVAAIREADSVGRSLGLKLLLENPQQNKAEILKFAQDTAKGVREALLGLLYQQTDWEGDIIALLSSKKAGDRDAAVRVLTKWNREKYAPLLTEALEKEKNGKIRALIDNALNGDNAGQSGERHISLEDLVKDIHKGNKKRTLAWAYETPFSKVHKKSGGEAEEEYLQAILLSYSAMSPCGISPSAATLADALREEELAIYMNELFDKWLEAGAESKKRWVLYAAAVHGGNAIVEKLRRQIQEWPQAARGAIASEAVQALALSPRPQALLIVDGISRKFKFKQVKAAAGKALEFAAEQLGITKEELADRIVPDLGFDEKMERHFDYGERQFTVTITPALEIEVFDENGKKLKNLPAPGKRDDETKAAAAYEEFKQMKKQMKATIGSQKMRLDMALSTERQWSVAAWKDLFVKNPIMHQFAIGLIWGIYEDGKLVTSFRYMEDGTFNTEDEDEFELPQGGGTEQAAGDEAENPECSVAERPTDDGSGSLECSVAGQSADNGSVQTEDKNGSHREGEACRIGLVHPIELSEESLEAWRQQLEDYEIVQPIEQLDRQVYHRTKEEEEQKSLERFGGCIVNDLSLGGKLMGDGWYRGSVQDAGGFYTYYREDPDLSLGVELHFSGSYVGGLNEDVTVYEARFYEAGTIKRGSYMYDEAEEKNSYALRDVPERYFSEIVRQIARAVASGKDRNENWKSERR